MESGMASRTASNSFESVIVKMNDRKARNLKFESVLRGVAKGNLYYKKFSQEQVSLGAKNYSTNRCSDTRGSIVGNMHTSFGLYQIAFQDP